MQFFSQCYSRLSGRHMVRMRGNMAEHMVLQHFFYAWDRRWKLNIQHIYIYTTRCSSLAVTWLYQRWAISLLGALLSLIISIKLCISKALKAALLAPITAGLLQILNEWSISCCSAQFRLWALMTCIAWSLMCMCWDKDLFGYMSVSGPSN